MTLKDLFLSVQARLKDRISEAGYIDKDWGQLVPEIPSVKWPCILLDVDNVNYTQAGAGRQMAEPTITITVADMRLGSSSAAAPSPEDAYKTIELLEKIHGVLHLFHEEGYNPLFRTNLKKVVADSSKECYQMTYQTAFAVDYDTGSTQAEGIKARVQITGCR